MKQSIIQTKSLDFSVRLVKYLIGLDQGFFNPLYKQLLRSGTSIGANIEEAYAAQSKNDFIAKAHIALKENQETKYRLKIMIECYPKTTDIRRGFLNDAEELSKIITQILITMKQKK